ncbi:YfhO family protein [Falsiroseomonas oryzae]|uniref:YfhO family protein n=1 Tax=Falsiroseomonas oryzae TaxID=2766473 RepID=UPI0022EA522B|nr:YfhO family protein [Roseomonas sp. MO-31]
MASALWPRNTFNTAHDVRRFEALPHDRQAALTPPRPLALAETVAATAAGPIATFATAGDGLSFHTIRRGYNGQVFAVSAARAGTVVSTINHDPGWRVTVDGRRVPTHRFNLRLLAFDVPAGEHRIDLEYWPFGRALYPVAAILTLLALGVLALVAAGSHGQPRRLASQAGGASVPSQKLR